MKLFPTFCFFVFIVCYFSNTSRKPYGFSIRLGNKSKQLGFTTLPDSVQVYGKKPLVLEGPNAFAVDSQGNIYFLDIINQLVKKFDSFGRYQKSFPFPRISNKLESDYSQIQIADNGEIWLLDTLNNMLVNISETQKWNPEKTLILPKKVLKKSLVLSRFLIQNKKFVLSDKTTGRVFLTWIEKGKPKIKTIAQNNKVQKTLYTKQGSILGFQSNKRHSEIIDLYLVSKNKAKPWFSLNQVKNLMEPRFLGFDKDNLVFAMFTGGEFKKQLKEIHIYSEKGKLVEKFPLHLDELNWNFQNQVLLKNGIIYAIKLLEKSKSLFVYKLKL